MGRIDPQPVDDYNGTMKLILASAGALLAALAPLHAAEPAPAANLPDLPSVEANRPVIETGNASRENPALPSVSAPAPSRQLPSADQLEQLKKERNWLVEGVKEQQQAAAKKPAEDMSQSIIEMVLDRQRKGFASPTDRPSTPGLPRPTESRTSPENPPAFTPAISTSAFDLLPDQRTTLPGSADSESILSRERSLAARGSLNATPAASAAPARDPLANPFANLPIPEGALPSPRRNTSPLNPTDPAAPASPWGDATTPSSPWNTGTASASPSTAMPLAPDTGAPRMAIEQPYDYLRAQEEQRRRQQLMDSSRPKVQNLRNPIPEPSQARLF